MPPPGKVKTEAETNAAAWVATRGGFAGAARWGLYSSAIAAAGFAFSPIYRRLTMQFKVFVFFGPMVLGGFIEADRRLREHELIMRREKRRARDAELWRRYEEDYEDG